MLKPAQEFGKPAQEFLYILGIDYYIFEGEWAAVFSPISGFSTKYKNKTMV